MNSKQEVYEYLNSKGWVKLDDYEEQVVPLGSGESNTNFLITANELSGEVQYLFRVNHLSRLGLMDHVEYEFAVLQAVRRSGVTPRPFYCDSEPGSLGMGVMLMEYLEGRPLVCNDDWKVAAETLATVHCVPAGVRLLQQKNPVLDSVRHCRKVVEKIGTREDGDKVLAQLGMSIEKLEYIAGEVEEFFDDDFPVIVNGSVRPSDFLVDDENGDEDKTGVLVDWECGVVSSRYVDMGQFFVQASLAGESGYCRDDDEKKRFSEAYMNAAGLDVPVEEFIRRANLFGQAAVIRSMILKSDV
jgi:aminoglycoside phosphotransferase (APT) family kinase protein